MFTLFRQMYDAQNEFILNSIDSNRNKMYYKASVAEVFNVMLNCSTFDDAQILVLTKGLKDSNKYLTINPFSKANKYHLLAIDVASDIIKSLDLRFISGGGNNTYSLG